MVGVSVVGVMQAVVLAVGASYAEAWQKSNDEGRPLVVLVGADWCPACVQMKQAVLPQLEQNGELAGACFAVVNLDHQPSLARKLLSGSSVPQLVMFHKSAGGWQRSRLVGSQSVGTVRSMVRRGLEESVDLVASKPVGPSGSAERGSE